MSDERRLLIVDDDPLVGFQLSDILSEQGYAPEAMESGIELLEKLDTVPDNTLILLDVNMPLMDGYELIKRVR